MPLGFATLPLDPAQLRALAEANYTIVDQAQRTPGLLIVQAPDVPPEPENAAHGGGAAQVTSNGDDH